MINLLPSHGFLTMELLCSEILLTRLQDFLPPEDWDVFNCCSIMCRDCTIHLVTFHGFPGSYESDSDTGAEITLAISAAQRYLYQVSSRQELQVALR